MSHWYLDPGPDTAHSSQESNCWALKWSSFSTDEIYNYLHSSTTCITQKL